MTIHRIPKYPSKMPTAIFLDSGGVINDNAQRAPQWLRYLGEFLPTTALGGTAQAWSMANAQIVRPFFSRWYEFMTQATELAAQAQAANSNNKNGIETNVYRIFERLHLLIWIKEMCRAAFSQVPELETKVLPTLTDEDLLEIAQSAQKYAIERVKAAYPGAVETIHLLGESKEYKLFTSSGDCFEDLEIILKGLGVFECFDAIYGSDKVNCLKMSALYYEKVFEQLGINVVKRDDAGEVVSSTDGEEEVVVLDDSDKVLRWARAHGARTVLITETELNLSLEVNRHIDYQLRSLSELPALLDSWREHLEN
ncbi:hypothetical protein BG011_008110 [Mortierella polycephala]|uniref:HAD-like protein n=1 Tax=Mortierella polycephala TaxID=41804 RepID=A0A9P6PPL0_9FUNG|nr:hypothetical protein BG011_008110 [Mortierella polycephala]